VRKLERIETLGSKFKKAKDLVTGSTTWKNIANSLPARAAGGLKSVIDGAIDRKDFNTYLDHLTKLKNANFGVADNPALKDRLYKIGLNSFMITDRTKRRELQTKINDIFSTMLELAKGNVANDVQSKMGEKAAPEVQAKMDKFKGFEITIE
jgi:hypothetical protein